MAAEVIRAWAEIATALGVGLSGLVIYAWWRLRLRSWPVSGRDEAMRRHINQHYS
jgi:hypothetical protein